MKFFIALIIILIALAAFSLEVRAQTFYGPTEYLENVDSPLYGESFAYFHLENFEDGLLNTLGASASTGDIVLPSNNTDSVDADDGVIDGSGAGGHSWFTSAGWSGITFTFDGNVLGNLPTYAGVVWTDGITNGNTVTFEAFDSFNASLGTVVAGGLGDNSYGGGTAEDRFFGLTYGRGISAIKIKITEVSGMEVDHLQYGVIKPIFADGFE